MCAHNSWLPVGKAEPGEVQTGVCRGCGGAGYVPDGREPDLSFELLRTMHANRRSGPPWAVQRGTRTVYPRPNYKKAARGRYAGV